MTSRLTSEAFIPSVPIVTPSLTAIVLNSIGVPPAARMPALTNSASRRWLIVARHRLDPGRRDADDRLGEVLVGEPDRLEHRPRAGPVGAVGEGGGVALGGIGGGRRVGHARRLPRPVDLGGRLPV